MQSPTSPRFVSIASSKPSKSFFSLSHASIALFLSSLSNLSSSLIHLSSIPAFGLFLLTYNQYNLSSIYCWIYMYPAYMLCLPFAWLYPSLYLPFSSLDFPFSTLGSSLLYTRPSIRALCNSLSLYSYYWLFAHICHRLFVVAIIIPVIKIFVQSML